MCNGELQQEEIPAWDDWVLAESRRRYLFSKPIISHAELSVLLLTSARTAIILMMIIHIFEIEHGPGFKQCGGFMELALPCSKSLWQASDERAWELEYRRQYMRRNTTNQNTKIIPTYRDLLLDNLDQNDTTLASRTEYLSEWFLEMDDLGTLVTMAVSTL